jgi:UDP-2,3-diacylglucosamine pyrophosphatase LpxH
MTISASEIAKLLVDCETNGAAFPYVCTDESRTPVQVATHGAEIFVVSDLHLADGRRKDGRYGGTENFFCDGSFLRFLRQAHANLKAPNAMLIINGDFIDFLRVLYRPRQKEDFSEWEELLEAIGIPRPVSELRASIKFKERIYGLRTNDYKSVLKLAIVVKGHPDFFEALAEWLGGGHHIVVVKGNHDLEWYWQPVRNYFRLVLAQRLALQAGTTDVKSVLEKTVLPNVRFIDDSMVVDGDFYVEHGHFYDKYAHVVGKAVRPSGKELNIPFGSFLNRYLLNRLELNLPFLDNVRPTTNILPLLIREHLPVALELLFRHIPLMLWTIPKFYLRYMFSQLFWFFLLVIAPVVLIAWLIFGSGLDLGLTTLSQPQGFLHKTVLNSLTSLGGMVFSYVLARFVSWLNLVEPSNLTKYARKKLAEMHQDRLITFGHTHNPDQFRQGEQWFFNTGTWIPIVEISSAALREDKTYTFLHLRPDCNGRLSGALWRWNDDSGRAEGAVVIAPAREGAEVAKSGKAQTKCL